MGKELLPEVNRNMNNNIWVFIQDSAPSHRANIVQDFLKKNLGKRFIKHTECLPLCPGCNPLDYHFWNKINEKVYEDRFSQFFGNSNELKKRQKKVWPQVVHDLTEIRKALKQFTSSLKVVE